MKRYYFATLRFKNGNRIVDMFTANDEAEVKEKAKAAYGRNGEYEIIIEPFED